MEEKVQQKIYEKIIIDLQQNLRSTVSVAKSLFVEFPPRNFKFPGGSIIQRLAMRSTKKDVVVGVRKIVASDGLVFLDNRNVEDIFSLVFEGHEFSMADLPQQFRLDKERTPFQLFFATDLICDCLVQQDKAKDTYVITGETFVQDTNGNDLCIQPFQIDVEFTPLEPDVIIKIIGPRGGGRLKYAELNKNAYVEIGEIQITNCGKFRRTPSVDFNLSVSVTDKDGVTLPDVITSDNLTLPRVKVGLGNDANLCVNKLVSSIENIDGIEDFLPSRYKIFMNFSDIPNPIDDVKEIFNIRVNGSYALSYDTDLQKPFRHSKSFDLMKDQQGTEISVRVDGSLVKVGETFNAQPYKFIPGSAFCCESVVDLGNIATDTSRGGCLRIQGVSLFTSISSDNVNVYDANSRMVDINTMVKLGGDLYDEIKEDGYIDILNGNSAPHQIKVLFDPARFHYIQPDSMYTIDIISCIDVSYRENVDGRPWSEVPIKTYKFYLSRNLELLPYPQWLCVDYGSSAIVAQYDGNVLELSKTRKDIFSRVAKESKESNNWEIPLSESESKTKFITSDMLFNGLPNNSEDKSSLCSEQDKDVPHSYDSLSLLLSPTQSMMIANYQRNLPCLKLLVGNQYLPDNKDYNGYSYLRRDINGVVSRTTVGDSKLSEEPNSLARIDTLFDEAYKIVFRHYLSPSIPNMDRINRLVLTYPNSYTPEHLRVLESIAKSTFSNLRQGCLKFVSESDAVAAYYIDHWKEYNIGNMEDDEYILVYDMGAGTLDLTYLVKKYNHATQTYHLDILGKLGITKAGNYLDFVLASIMNQSLAKTDRPSGANADKVANGRIQLKDLVKNTIKPILNENHADNIIHFEYRGGEVNKSISDILNAAKFRKYLTECTTDVINRMEGYLGRPLKINTLIMSGRSCRLEPLQKALRAAVGKKAFDEQNVNIINLDKPINLSANRQNQESADRQKIAVVQGAEIYAGKFNDEKSHVKITSRRIYASFGVAFRRIGGEFDYVELANHADMPFTSEKGSKIFSSKTLKGMTDTKEIILIQSYLSELATKDALRKMDFEYISEMSRFSTDSFSGIESLEAAIGLDRSNRVSLYINGNPARGEVPRGIDLNNEITKQSIWPATI